MNKDNTARDLLRNKIIDEPEFILDDQDVMSALVRANERSLGKNIVDLRGIAMERLESRLDRLEDTHRSVIAAAYENLAGMNLIHGAVQKLLEPATFSDFLEIMQSDLLDTLRVARLRLWLESGSPEAASLGYEDVLTIVPEGYVATYITGGRDIVARPHTLRQIASAPPEVYGENADFIKSEALLKLDLGEGRLPGLLILGSEDPHQFKPNQGTDLLSFFGRVFELTLRRWLA